MGKKKRGKGDSNEVDPLCNECNKYDITDNQGESEIDWVVCGACEKWFHTKCLVTTEKARQVLNEEVNIYVVCKKCQNLAIKHVWY